MKSSRKIYFSLKRKADRNLFYTYLFTLFVALVLCSAIWTFGIYTMAKNESIGLIETQFRLEHYITRKGFGADILNNRELNGFVGDYDCLVITPKDKILPQITYHSFFMKNPPPKTNWIDNSIKKIINYTLFREGSFYTVNNYNDEKKMYIELVGYNQQVFAELNNEINTPDFEGTFTSSKNLTEALLPGAKTLLIFTLTVFSILFILKTLMFRGVYRLFVHPLRNLNDCLDRAMVAWEVRPAEMEKTASEDVNEVAKKIHYILNGMVDLYNSTEDFLEEVAHETKNPLNNIVNTAEFIKDTNPEIEESMNLIMNQAYTINSLLDGLRGAVELQIIGDTPRKADSDIKGILEDIIQEFQMIYADREFITEIQNNFSKHATMDEKLVSLIIRNILGNAIKYSKNNTPITVSLSTNDWFWIELTVTNIGPSIPVDIQEKIFEKYYRGKSTEKKVPGSGLGLWIVKELVDRHKGHIFARSGNGTTIFSIILEPTPEQIETENEWTQSQNQNETDT